MGAGAARAAAARKAEAAARAATARARTAAERASAARAATARTAAARAEATRRAAARGVAARGAAGGRCAAPGGVRVLGDARARAGGLARAVGELLEGAVVERQAHIEERTCEGEQGHEKAAPEHTHVMCVHTGRGSKYSAAEHAKVLGPDAAAAPPTVATFQLGSLLPGLRPCAPPLLRESARIKGDKAGVSKQRPHATVASPPSVRPRHVRRMC